MSANEGFHLRLGTDDSLDILSSLNKQLNDEFYPEVGMNEVELGASIRELMHADHDAFLFEVGGRAVGYSLVRRGTDPLQVQQFYMAREARGNGYNNLAVILLEEATKASSIEADANVWRAAVGSM